MAKFTKVNIGEAVASSGGKVWKKLSVGSSGASNFTLSDGSTLVTADGQTFNAKENNL